MKIEITVDASNICSVISAYWRCMYELHQIKVEEGRGCKYVRRKKLQKL